MNENIPIQEIPAPKRTYTVKEVSEMLGIGKTAAYNFVKENHFKIVRVGAAIRISKNSFDEWLDSQQF